MANVVTGDGSLGGRGLLVKPTIVADVQQDDEIVQDEVFGRPPPCGVSPPMMR